MADAQVSPIGLAAVERLVGSTEKVAQAALDVARQRTDGGKGIDDAQVHCERLAYVATEVARRQGVPGIRPCRRGARARRSGRRRDGGGVRRRRRAPAARARSRRTPTSSAWPTRFSTRRSGERRRSRRCGRRCTRRACVPSAATSPNTAGPTTAGSRTTWRCMTRDSVRQFAEAEVAPLAEHIHRHDELVPDAIIDKMAELGYFGMAVPEEYGGGGMGNLAHDHHHRGAVALLARRRRQSDHAPGDPHQGAAQGRHRGTEAEVAAAARRRRDHGGDLGDRARHRLRRRVGQVPRRGGRGRRPQGLRHQRREGVVHVRRPRQRARAAGAHRSGPEDGRARPVAVHRREGRVRPGTSSRCASRPAAC